MQKQNYELKNEKIKSAFLDLKQNHPEQLTGPLNLSWSNWGFGIETLAESAARLNKAGIKFIELHGNHYGPDLGYQVHETLRILNDYDIKVGGICGMFSADNDLSSNRAVHRQAAIEYLKREIEFTSAVPRPTMTPNLNGASIPCGWSPTYSLKTISRLPLSRSGPRR